MAEAVETPAKGGKGGLALWAILGLAAAGGGAALPWFLPHAHEGEHKSQRDDAHAPKQTVMQFGDVVVNLGEERLTRFLRVKMMLVIDEAHAKELEELVNKRRPHLKNWLIGYLSDQTLPEVSRAAGVNRIRREVRDQFNAMLFEDGSEKIHEVLFDEFVVQ